MIRSVDTVPTDGFDELYRIRIQSRASRADSAQVASYPAAAK